MVLGSRLRYDTQEQITCEFHRRDSLVRKYLDWVEFSVEGRTRLIKLRLYQAGIVTVFEGIWGFRKMELRTFDMPSGLGRGPGE